MTIREPDSAAPQTATTAAAEDATVTFNGTQPDEDGVNKGAVTSASPAEESATETTEVASSSSSGPAPSFYRLNAFQHDESDDDLGKFGSVPTSDDMKNETTNTTCGSSVTNSGKQSRNVDFKSVIIREYDITIGDNPYCSYGVPIGLDWTHGEEEVIPIDFFEASHKRRRTARPRCRCRTSGPN